MCTVIGEKTSNDEVKDRYLIVYVLFASIGVVQFLPGTFFVTAHDYWMYKFRNTTTDDVDSSHRTVLQARFSSTVTICTQIAVVLSSILGIFFGHKLSVPFRLYTSLVSAWALFILLAIFIHVDTDSWQTGFFVMTMFVVVVINAMTTNMALTFLSILYKFPPKYLGAFLNGQGAAAICTACLQIVSLAVGISTTKSALVYFWIAIALITWCLFLMIVCSRLNNFFIYYNSMDTYDKKQRRMISWGEFLAVFKSMWKCFGILVFYFVTVSPIHPALTSLVASEGEGEGEWNDVYFVPVITFLLSAVGDYLGRLAAINFKAMTNIDGTWYVISSAVRLLVFAPLILLCNIQPRKHLPVVFHHDYQYIIIMVFFTFSNGFILCMQNLLIPKIVSPEKLEDAYHVHLLGAAVLYGGLCFLGFISMEIV